MPWLQLIAEVQNPEIAPLEQAMLNSGAVSVTLQECRTRDEEEQAILEPPLGETPLWDSTRLTALYDADSDTQKIQWLIAESLANAPSLRWEQLEDKDWEREWMANYQPIQCAPTLWICPSWLSPIDPDATNLLLDPGLAFGTGTHPTTFLCMQWLAEQNLTGLTVLDYGCGSGILGITALLLGAKQVIGVDIDPQALSATRNNVERNRLDSTRFPVHLPNKMTLSTPVDLVISNILAGPLVELAPLLNEHLKPGGKLCLSGILSKQTKRVVQAYNSSIHFEPSAQKEDWVRLSGTRKSQ